MINTLKQIVTNLTNQKVDFVIWANGKDFQDVDKVINHYSEVAMNYGPDSPYARSEGWEIDVDFALELTGVNKDVVLLEFTETLQGE